MGGSIPELIHLTPWEVLRRLPTVETHLQGAWRDLEIQLLNMDRKLDLIIGRLRNIDRKLDGMCAELKADLRAEFGEIKAFLQERLEASRQCGG